MSLSQVDRSFSGEEVKKLHKTLLVTCAFAVTDGAAAIQVGCRTLRAIYDVRRRLVFRKFSLLKDEGHTGPTFVIKTGVHLLNVFRAHQAFGGALFRFGF